MPIKMPDNYWTGKPMLEARMPWLTPGAVDRLSRFILPDQVVLEFGCGGSTLFFSDRCLSVVSWENDRAWIKEVQSRLKRTNAMLLWNLDFVLSLPQQFDLVVVDSNGLTTDREAISRQAINKVMPEGWFVLDNYGRYDLGFLRGWVFEKYDDPHWSGGGTLISHRP